MKKLKLDYRPWDKRRIWHLYYWLSFILFFTIVWGTYDHNYFRNFMIQMFSLPSRVILVYFTIYYLFPKFLLKKQYWHFLLYYTSTLILIAIFIQRPIFIFIIQPYYLIDFLSSRFLAVTEIMNTILDINIAVIVPFGYKLYNNWNKIQEKAIALEEKQAELLNSKKFIYLKIEKSLLKIYLKDIIYIESLRNHIKVKTVNKEVIAYKSLSLIQSELATKMFLRVHRSFIINIDFIESFSPNKILLPDSIIPVGRKYKSKVKDSLGYY